MLNEAVVDPMGKSQYVVQNYNQHLHLQYKEGVHAYIRSYNYVIRPATINHVSAKNC